MTTNKQKGQQGIQSIEVGGRVLRALMMSRHPQMLRDIAANAQMPPAKAHRYLVSLCRMGLVEQQLETGLYELGSFSLELGLAALARLEPVTVAAPGLLDLGRETGQTVALAVWANHGATIVRWSGVDAPVAASLRVGSIMPITRSATGQVFLTYLSSEPTRALLKKELAENGRVGLKPTTREEVDRLAAQIRERGYAFTSDFIPGISGIAVPIFDHTGGLSMGLVVLGYTKPFESKIEAYAAAALRKANLLSKRLGYARPD
jgi:DNA-binding IclR family transcriptional regulator